MMTSKNLRAFCLGVILCGCEQERICNQHTSGICINTHRHIIDDSLVDLTVSLVEHYTSLHFARSIDIKSAAEKHNLLLSVRPMSRTSELCDSDDPLFTGCYDRSDDVLEIGWIEDKVAFYSSIAHELLHFVSKRILDIDDDTDLRHETPGMWMDWTRDIADQDITIEGQVSTALRDHLK